VNAEPDVLGAHCPQCSASILDDDVFCEACGCRLIEDPTGPDLEPASGPDHVDLDLGAVAGVSDRGLAHRRNEDAFALDARGDHLVAVVCDGVSASVTPDRAARVAADTAAQMLAAAVDDGSDLTTAMAEAITVARAAVERVPWVATQRLAAPSCTLVAAIWDGHAMTVASVGDSRAYWIGRDDAALLTEDDSWALHQVRAGDLTPEDAAQHPWAHAITNWIGADAPDESLHVETIEPEGDGLLVVCTDGLWNYVPEPDALAALVRAIDDDTPHAVADALVSHALAQGGADNVTVAVLAVTVPSALPSSPLSEEQS
jgi:serine/threonine protein phosphatase PrpC